MTTNNTTTTTVVTTPSLSVNRTSTLAFNYNKKIMEADQNASVSALQDLEQYWEERSQRASDAARRTMSKLNNPKTRNGRSDEDPYAARNRQAGVLSTQLLRRIRTALKAAQSIEKDGAIGERIDRTLLMPLIRHQVTTNPATATEAFKPWMKAFSEADMFDLLQGAPRKGFDNNRCGIAQYTHEGYYTIQPADTGFLLVGKNNELLLSGDEVYSLIMNMDQATMQAVPYTQAGVFGTESQNANYDGITFVVSSVTVKDEHGVEVELGTIRVSMEYKIYKVLGLATAFGHYPEVEEYKGLRILNDLILKIFGNRKYVPQNRFEFEQLWACMLVFIAKDGEQGFKMKKKEYIEEAFLPGKYATKRFISNKEELFDSEIFKLGLQRYETERAEKADKAPKPTQVKQAAAPATSSKATIKDEDFLAAFGDQEQQEEEEHPF